MADQDRSLPDRSDAASLDAQGSERTRVLVLSTLAFTVLFAVWVMFGFLSIPIRKELKLSEVQLGWLVSIAVLSGSVLRLSFGIWADRVGGRKVMAGLLLASALPCAAVAYVHSYVGLCICALLFGVAGNSFTVGVSWVSAWFPRQVQGSALGIFGAGNVGASVTKLAGPALIALVTAPLFGGLVPAGWRFIPVLYATALLVMAALVWCYAPSEDRLPGKGRPIGEMLLPLRELRVWRFSLYYVVVFGAYVALSVWLPKYYVDVYHLKLANAAALTALFIFPASLLRPLGGWLSDRFGARLTLSWVFGVMAFACAGLALPSGTISREIFSPIGLYDATAGAIGVAGFTSLLLLVGIGMGIGKAAVYKFIPQYYPRDVGAVGGLVGMLGALGGFFLPPIFAYTRSTTGSPQTVFAVMLTLVAWCGIWLRIVVSRMNASGPSLTETTTEALGSAGIRA